MKLKEMHVFFPVFLLAGLFSFLPAMVVYGWQNTDYMIMLAEARENNMSLWAMNGSWIYAGFVYCVFYTGFAWLFTKIFQDENGEPNALEDFKTGLVEEVNNRE